MRHACLPYYHPTSCLISYWSETVSLWLLRWPRCSVARNQLCCRWKSPELCQTSATGWVSRGRWGPYRRRTSLDDLWRREHQRISRLRRWCRIWNSSERLHQESSEAVSCCNYRLSFYGLGPRCWGHLHIQRAWSWVHWGGWSSSLELKDKDVPQVEPYGTPRANRDCTAMFDSIPPIYKKTAIPVYKVRGNIKSVHGSEEDPRVNSLKGLL